VKAEELLELWKRLKIKHESGAAGANEPLMSDRKFLDDFYI